VVGDTLGEIATFEVGVNVFPITRGGGYPQNLALAKLQEAIMNYSSAIEQLAPVVYEPNTTFSRWRWSMMVLYEILPIVASGGEEVLCEVEVGMPS